MYIHIYIFRSIRSIIHYGNVNRDATTYQSIYILMTTYHPTVAMIGQGGQIG